VSGGFAGVDGVRPDRRPRELLDEEVLLHGQARGGEEADRLCAVLGLHSEEAFRRDLVGVLPGGRVELAVLAADERFGQPVRVVDEVEGEAALDAEVALVRDVVRLRGHLDDSFRLRVDVEVELAADAAAVFSVMAGYDPGDATTLDRPAPPIRLDGQPDLRGLKIGVPQEYFIEGIQPEVEAGVRSAIGVLEGLGAKVQPVSLPHTEYALPVYYLIAPAEASANLARYDGVRFGLREAEESLLEMYKRTRGCGFGAEVKRRIMLGTYALSAGYYDAYYGQAQKVRTLIKRDFETAFESVDVIAAPVAPTTAFRLGEHTDDPLAMYLEDVFTLPANLAGVPGLAFPVGFDARGMPVGMQLMGRHFGEETLFKAAHAYQQVTDWHTRTPVL